VLVKMVKMSEMTNLAILDCPSEVQIFPDASSTRARPLRKASFRHTVLAIFLHAHPTAVAHAHKQLASRLPLHTSLISLVIKAYLLSAARTPTGALDTSLMQIASAIPAHPQLVRPVPPGL
jgi:hypothetical protein